MLIGFHERLLAELKRSLPKDTRIKINVPADRQYLCWLGGSLLVGLPAFQKMWITKKVLPSPATLVNFSCRNGKNKAREY